MPAVTFRHSTAQISQNCGVFEATFRCTCALVTMPLAVVVGPFQPAGFQLEAGTR